jgi:UDP-glucuronate decarboxylase
MRIHLVTGGAGFLGSHLIDRLMEAGDEVICLDNYFTGRKRDIEYQVCHVFFLLVVYLVIERIKPLGRPQIDLARQQLGWQPTVSLEQGL